MNLYVKKSECKKNHNRDEQNKQVKHKINKIAKSQTTLALT